MTSLKGPKRRTPASFPHTLTPLRLFGEQNAARRLPLISRHSDYGVPTGALDLVCDAFGAAPVRRIGQPTASRAPSYASAVAIPLPMPFEAPVTIAVFSTSLAMRHPATFGAIFEPRSESQNTPNQR